MQNYFHDFFDKLKEMAISVLPFFLIIMTLYLIFLPFNIFMFLAIIIATLLMIIGMALFNIGVDMSTMKMGGYVGSNLSKSRRFKFMLVLSLVMGFVVTIAEPDLMVLAEQVPGVNKWVILITVSLGTGIFLLLSTIRTLFRISIKSILNMTYILAIVLCLVTPNKSFIPLSFDGLGVTTGAVSVPFIMAFGLGICAVRSGKNNQEDGFGLIGMASAGPILSVLIVSLFIKSNSNVTTEVVELISTAGSMGSSFVSNLFNYMFEVFIVIIPIFIFFLIYNFKYLKLPKTNLIRIFIGLIYTYIGLLIFLCGVNSGYLPTANELGEVIASKVKWVLIPIALIIGFFLVFAEPAVHVLNKQIEDITEGVIRRKTMLIAISIGVAIAMLLSVIRALWGINFLYFVIPIIVIIIALSFTCPSLFYSIAFDSGGAAAGSITASFVLPFIIGISNSTGLDIMNYAFGTIALIALMPTIVIEIMGTRYNYVINKNKKKTRRKSRVHEITIYEFD